MNKIIAKLLKFKFFLCLHCHITVFCICVQDTEEALMMNLRDSHILNHKQNLEWNWLLIATILKVRLLSCNTTHPMSVLSLLSDIKMLLFFSPPVAKRKPQEQQR